MFIATLRVDEIAEILNTKLVTLENDSVLV